MSRPWRPSFARLADLAREDTPPHLDVSSRVLDTLRNRSATAERDWLLWVGSVLSLAAAVAVAVLGNSQGVFGSDPLVELMQVFLPIVQ